MTFFVEQPGNKDVYFKLNEFSPDGSVELWVRQGNKEECLLEITSEGKVRFIPQQYRFSGITYNIKGEIMPDWS